MRTGRCLLFWAVVMLWSAGCTPFRNVRVEGWSVDGVRIKGLRSVEAVLKVSVDNPARRFTLSDLEGVLYKGEAAVARYSAQPLTVEARTQADYPVQCRAAIADSLTVLGFLSAMAGAAPDDFRTTITGRFRPGHGMKRKFRLERIPVGALLRK